MVANNAINLSQSGLVSYNGNGTFFGVSLQSTSSNLTITNPDGTAGNPSFAISGTMTWNDVTTTSQALSTYNGYVSDNTSLVTFTLPATANLGDTIQILGKGAGGWKVVQNALQQIIVGNKFTTVGVTGSIASTNQYDTVELKCITSGTSTVWTAKETGNIGII